MNTGLKEMITIVLEGPYNQIIKKTSYSGNEKVLFGKKNGKLSHLDSFSYDTFGPDDMDEVISRLKETKETLTDLAMISHLEEVIRLAIHCKNTNGSTLTFTPFFE